MIGLVQRVTTATVTIQGETIAQIDRGILVFVGIRKEDAKQNAERLMKRLLSFRIFPDQHGKMNLSVQDVEAGLLIVPQFTLVADTRSGTRASFTAGANPAAANNLFQNLIEIARGSYRQVAFGEFGADMQVSLTNDGPVTFVLEA